MSFMLLLILIFLSMSLIKADRTEWLIVAATTAGIWINLQYFGKNDAELYINRAGITFAGASLLCFRRSFVGFYHAIVFFLILFAYGALAFDASQGRHILIYNNYESVIYGLVGCQLIGVIPTLRGFFMDSIANSSPSIADLFWGKKQ